MLKESCVRCSKTALQFEDTAGVHPGAENGRSECEPAARAQTGLAAPDTQPPRAALAERIEGGRDQQGAAAAMERFHENPADPPYFLALCTAATLIIDCRSWSTREFRTLRLVTVSPVPSLPQDTHVITTYGQRLLTTG